jgi:hypothetical protein
VTVGELMIELSRHDLREVVHIETDDGWLAINGVRSMPHDDLRVVLIEAG